MWTWFTRQKQSIQDVEQYFRDGKDEIAKRNLILLRTTSICMAILIVIFIFLTPIVLPLWKPTLYHYFLFVYTTLFAIISSLIMAHGQKHITYMKTKALAGIFVLGVMLLLICLDTVAYPFAAQVFVVVYLVITPILFIVPVLEMLFTQVIFVAAFVIMAQHFKDPEIVSGDYFSAVLGAAVGIVAYVIVARIRIHDYNQRIAYKISSEIDSLTQIENRATCKQRIDSYLEHKAEECACAMMILDVDHFKQINDQLGHEKGDEVLYGVAQKLKQVFRSGDIIGRFGGDEFIVFMKDMKDGAVLDEKCNYLNQQISGLLDGQFEITCSMGICYLDRGVSNLEIMFHVADTALYEAKKSHNGKHVVQELNPVTR